MCTAEGATIEEYRDLASELKILMHVGVHTNIVNLLGACIKRDGILVILEYAPHGSLLKFLRGKRDVYEATWSTTTSDPEIRLDISDLVGYAFQISRGMEYLASKKVKDLTTFLKQNQTPSFIWMLFARTCSLAVFVILFVNLTDSLGLLFCAELNVIILAKRKYRAWS